MTLESWKSSLETGCFFVEKNVDKLWISLSMVHTKATALPLQSKMIVLPDRRDTSKNILKNDIL